MTNFAMWRFTGGLPETPCGAGSMLAATDHLRSRLPGVLANLSVMTLLDAPCGDFNWMRDVDLTGIDYIGCDLDHLPLARANGTKASARTVRFVELDIVKGKLPRSDAILCRDFLQHLPNEMALEALRNFKRSGTEWLLMTSHLNTVNEDIEAPGMFRPLNLTLEPFNLPEPAIAIDDGAGRIVGVWAA